MPNLLAQIVLYSWPLVAWALFRRLPVPQALFSTILLGYLFIPERVGYDPPLLPALDKHLIPCLCAAVGVLITRRNEARLARRAARKAALVAGTSAERPAMPAPRPRPPRAVRVRRIAPAIIAVLMISPFLTWLTNQNPEVYAWRFIPGLTPHDLGSMLVSSAVLFLPFYLARRELGTREGQVGMLKVLAYCGLAYSLLTVWEARMSPQLNVKLYGFFAHDWLQHIRDGAFRPIVFLAHGLRVGIFLTMATLAALALARGNVDGKRRRWLLISIWMLMTLAISHNLGATLIALALLPVVLVFSARLQFLTCALIAAVVLFYPLARGSGLIPADRIVSVLSNISVDRAGSLEYRFDNEDILLEKANQRPVSGWGIWGRGRVYDPQTGQDLSTTDGSWIILIGSDGWVGYLGQFGLLCVPALLAMWLRRRYGLDSLDAGILVVLIANLVDLLPNSSLLPLTWLLAGSMWGRIEEAGGRQIERRRNADRAAQRGPSAAQPQRSRSGRKPGATRHPAT